MESRGSARRNTPKKCATRPNSVSCTVGSGKSVAGRRSRLVQVEISSFVQAHERRSASLATSGTMR
jgi:hypothetical protein